MRDLTAMAWTMTNALSDVPVGTRGEKYREERILLVSNAVIVNVCEGNDEQGTHSVRVHGLTEDASSEAVELTEMCERTKYRMVVAPHTYKVGAELYSKVLGMDGHEGPSDFLNSLFFLVLNGGQEAA